MFMGAPTGNMPVPMSTMRPSAAIPRPSPERTRTARETMCLPAQAPRVAVAAAMRNSAARNLRKPGTDYKKGERTRQRFGYEGKRGNSCPFLNNHGAGLRSMGHPGQIFGGFASNYLSNLLNLLSFLTTTDPTPKGPFPLNTLYIKTLRISCHSGTIVALRHRRR